VPILNWCIGRRGPIAITAQWADLSRARLGDRSLTARAIAALDLYPCDILFLHRDAEGQPVEARLTEIELARRAANWSNTVPVVPVRMTEAWLMFDESALRRSAGNPNGRVPLSLPPLRDVENLPDPKQFLAEALRTASELNARRRRAFNVNAAVRLIPEFISDFTPLLDVPAFARMHGAVADAVARLT
jgi:hypothetical protein